MTRGGAGCRGGQNPRADAFDFAAFRAAYGGDDPDARAAFSAEEAEWVEYRWTAGGAITRQVDVEAWDPAP